MTSLILLWNQSTWERRTEGTRIGVDRHIDFVAGDDKRPFNEVHDGDEIFVVNVLAGNVRLAGRLVADGRPVSEREAAKRLPQHRLIGKRLYVFGKQEALDEFRPSLQIPRDIVSRLQLIDVNGSRRPVHYERDDPTRVYRQEFRVPTKLAEESARELRRLLGVRLSETQERSDLASNGAEGWGSTAGQGPSLPPTTAQDERALRQIMERRGQPMFRQALIHAYQGRCCVTGSRVVDVLEAAHIRPHSDGGGYEVRNGLLLRADIHTLFDLGLLGVDRGGRILVSSDLDGSEYAELRGKRLLEPESSEQRPDYEALSERAKSVVGRARSTGS